MEEYITGTGQKVYVHDKDKCKGHHCVIHNPSDHHMKNWPTHWRQDIYLMERMCKHGVGHPDPDDIAYQTRAGANNSVAVHGCDGCCVDDVRCMEIETKTEDGIIYYKDDDKWKMAGRENHPLTEKFIDNIREVKLYESCSLP